MVRENTPGIQGSQTVLVPGWLRWHGGDGERSQTIGIDIPNCLDFGSHNGLPSVFLHLSTPDITLQIRWRDALVNDRITTVRSFCRFWTRRHLGSVREAAVEGRACSSTRRGGLRHGALEREITGAHDQSHTDRSL